MRYTDADIIEMAKDIITTLQFFVDFTEPDEIEEDYAEKIKEAYATLVDRDNNPNQGIRIKTYPELMQEEVYKILSLPKEYIKQEQPEVDLEEEIHRYFNPHGMKLQFDRSRGNTIFKPEQLIDFARHFAEWGATHIKTRKEE